MLPSGDGGDPLAPLRKSCLHNALNAHIRQAAKVWYVQDVLLFLHLVWGANEFALLAGSMVALPGGDWGKPLFCLRMFSS